MPVWSESLAKRLDPGDAPFVAIYRRGSKVLTFVAAEHVFTRDNSTIDAIRRAFADTDPSVVVIEGIPTRFGQNPAPILESVRRRETDDADAYAMGEATFTASQALARNVPFIGAEPTAIEEIDGLVAGGYSRPEVLFALVLRSLGQERRSGAMPVGDATAFDAAFDRSSRAIAYMTRSEPLTETQFTEDYIRMIGVTPVADAELSTRVNPGTGTRLHRLAADDGRFRDGHILSTILNQFAANDRVLVVYGHAHWTTLSAALRDRLGKPLVNTVTHR